MKNKSALSLIFLTVFIDLLGFGILIPILPSFATKILGVDETAIGIAIAIYSFVQFLFNPILGKYSDKYGRKPVITVCLLLNATGYVIFAFTHSFIMLLISRVVAGIGGSSIAVAQAYIADVTTKENRSKGMGLIGSAFGLGFVFGPLIGGFLSEYGYMVTGFVAGGFSLAAFIVTTILLPESLTKRTEPISETEVKKRKLLDVIAIKKVFHEPSRAIFISLFFILIFSFANIYGTFALLGLQVYGFSDMQNGLLFGIIGLVSAIVQGGMIGYIDKMLTKINILRIGSLIICIGLGLIPYGGNFLGLALISGFLSIGTGMLQPTLLSLISDVTPDNEQGITLGVNQSLAALARVAGPLWGGFAFEFLGYQFPFLTGAGFMLLVFLFTIFYLTHRNIN
ncbi:MAG: MFS transporter [Ignavibacteriota bacterium]|nr:MAG: MFS transporter [Chlorobiota bacterium]MBE7477890.1 MFS transporter [Ignavibacteriales bacterium]MBL1124412.1 MFS transporter [Ignavibacteriota bacterium]MCE7857335.1 MFS transporter [Ignavibacteria bacterium CHB3]MEB2296021.1 MFS transporter [Ignavibacteria bacterium]GJQ43265.1 MAG: tetracycline resistance MFS efflux pump [Ignavibacteriaceae bacterium]